MADPGEAIEPAWRGTLGIGTTAVATNNVLPLPLSLGASLLVEHRWLGLEAAVHFDAATICDHGSGDESACGLLWIYDLAPRFTLAPRSSFSPYASIRLQLTLSEPHGLVPAFGPRLGVRYRGRSLGFYAEAGPSFVPAEDGWPGRFLSNRRWYPQVSAGMTLSMW